MATKETDLAKLSKDISVIKKILIGNGKVGLCEEVRNHNYKIKDIEIHVKESLEFKKKLERILWVGLGIILISTANAESGTLLAKAYQLLISIF